LICFSFVTVVLEKQIQKECDLRSRALPPFVSDRTLQNTSSLAPELVIEIPGEFGIDDSRTTINQIQKGLGFKCPPAKHNQTLNATHELHSGEGAWHDRFVIEVSLFRRAGLYWVMIGDGPGKGGLVNDEAGHK
jgi:hypothetical protein